MNRRKFIKLSSIIISGLVVAPKICLREISKQTIKAKDWVFTSNKLATQTWARALWNTHKRDSFFKNMGIIQEIKKCKLIIK